MENEPWKGQFDFSLYRQICPSLNQKNKKRQPRFHGAANSARPPARDGLCDFHPDDLVDRSRNIIRSRSGYGDDNCIEYSSSVSLVTGGRNGQRTGDLI